MLFTKKNSLGLTLIELLVVSAMVAVIGLTMYSTFSNGLEIWKKVNQPLIQEDLDIFLEKFSHDIRNTVQFSGLGFLGSEHNLELPVLINSRRLKKFTVGKVVYSYYPEEERLTRQERDFSQIFSKAEDSTAQSLVNIRSFRFRYYNYDNDKKEYLWQDGWDKQSMPLAVRMELELEDGDRVYQFSRTASIIIGG